LQKKPDILSVQWSKFNAFDLVFTQLLTGTINSMIGHLRQLEFQQLENNMLEGTLPKEMGQLTKLGEELCFYHVQ